MTATHCPSIFARLAPMDTFVRTRAERLKQRRQPDASTQDEHEKLPLRILCAASPRSKALPTSLLL